MIDFEKVGSDLAQIVLRFTFDRESEVNKLVDGHPGVLRLNLLILFAWATSWRISDLIPSEYARRTLDAMWRPVFAAVMTMAEVTSDAAQAIVNERYGEYQEAVRSEQGGAAPMRIARSFTGFCNPDPEKGMYVFSLDPTTAIGVVSLLGAYCEAMQEALPEILESNAGPTKS